MKALSHRPLFALIPWALAGLISPAWLTSVAQANSPQIDLAAQLTYTATHADGTSTSGATCPVIQHIALLPIPSPAGTAMMAGATRIQSTVDGITLSADIFVRRTERAGETEYAVTAKVFDSADSFANEIGPLHVQSLEQLTPRFLSGGEHSSARGTVGFGLNLGSREDLGHCAE